MEGSYTQQLPNDSPISSMDDSGAEVEADTVAALEGGEFVSELNENDVLEGRGSRANQNEGNKRFRRLVEEMRPSYISTSSRKEKNDMVLDLVRGIQDNQGRFLRPLEAAEATTHGLDTRQDNYIVLSLEAAVEKTKQAIRYVHYKKIPAEAERDRLDRLVAEESGGRQAPILGGASSSSFVDYQDQLQLRSLGLLGAPAASQLQGLSQAIAALQASQMAAPAAGGAASSSSSLAASQPAPPSLVSTDTSTAESIASLLLGQRNSPPPTTMNREQRQQLILQQLLQQSGQQTQAPQQQSTTATSNPLMAALLLQQQQQQPNQAPPQGQFLLSHLTQMNQPAQATPSFQSLLQQLQQTNQAQPQGQSLFSQVVQMNQPASPAAPSIESLLQQLQQQQEEQQRQKQDLLLSLLANAQSQSQPTASLSQPAQAFSPDLQGLLSTLQQQLRQQQQQQSIPSTAPQPPLNALQTQQLLASLVMPVAAQSQRERQVKDEGPQSQPPTKRYKREER